MYIHFSSLNYSRVIDQFLHMDKNKILESKLAQREAELALINAVQEGILAKNSMPVIYELIGDQLKDIFDAQVTGIMTFDHNTQLEHFQYLFEDGERLFPDSRPLNKIRQHIIDTKEVLLVNENAEENMTRITGEILVAVPGTQKPSSLLFVPLIIKNKVIGCLTLQHLTKENAFHQSDVQLLSTLANSISLALENARLFNESEKRSDEMEVINSVQAGLVAEMAMQDIYDLVGERLRDLFDAQVTSIITFNQSDKTEHFQYLFESGERLYPKSRPYDKFREKLIAEKSPVLFNQKVMEKLSEINGTPFKPVPGTMMPKSALYVPMIVNDMTRGYITLQNYDREHAFSDSDVRLLNTLANSLSIALENARLFKETNNLLGITEQRNAELAVINSVQDGLVREMNMQAIYNLVGEKICEVLNTQTLIIRTFDHENGIENWRYAVENGKRIQVDPRPFIWANKILIESKKSIIVNRDFVATSKKHGGSGVTKGLPPKSAIFIPMLVGDVVVGSVSLQNVEIEDAFSESDVRLITTLTNSMSVALENARLFSETEQRNAELAVINSVQAGLVAEMDLQGIYDLVGDRVRDMFDSQVTLISTFDHENKTEDIHYVYEDGQRIYPDARPYDGVRQYLIDTKKNIHINENAEQAIIKFKASGKAAPGTKFPKSMVYVPLVIGDTVRGYVSLQNLDKEYAFSDSDVRLLSTLANSMSVALENARLFNETTRLLGETEQRATELQTVNSVSKAIVSQLELHALIKFVGEQMRETFRADIVYLAVHDQKTNMLHFPYSYGDVAESRIFGNGITENIILKKESLLINQNLEEAYNEIKAEKKGEMVESFLGVPIIAGTEAIGVISVQSKERGKRFSEADQRLLSTIAANVGIAIQNAEAYQKLQEALNNLKEAQSQLVQQEKLASLGQLTAGIAHEIKNPLNFVNNFSGVSLELIEELNEALDKTDLEEARAIAADIEGNLTRIHQHGTRADGIVQSMLQHSRGGDGKKVLTNLNALVKEYVNLAYHGMRANKNPIVVDISLELDENLKPVSLVGEDFSRVILNLCNNAFDAMRELAEKNREKSDTEKAVLSVKTRGNGQYVTIDIRDNGPGIPDEIKDKILQPFFTTKKGTQGTGLGLSITHDIIKAHGGTLQIESKVNSGSLFSIALPIAE
jgi:GAF domain-containing protein